MFLLVHNQKNLRINYKSIEVHTIFNIQICTGSKITIFFIPHNLYKFVDLFFSFLIIVFEAPLQKKKKK